MAGPRCKEDLIPAAKCQIYGASPPLPQATSPPRLNFIFHAYMGLHRGSNLSIDRNDSLGTDRGGWPGGRLGGHSHSGGLTLPPQRPKGS